MDSRFAIAQLLASTRDGEQAVMELQAVRPMFVSAYGGPDRNAQYLDRHR